MSSTFDRTGLRLICGEADKSSKSLNFDFLPPKTSFPSPLIPLPFLNQHPESKKNPPPLLFHPIQGRNCITSQAFS